MDTSASVKNIVLVVAALAVIAALAMWYFVWQKPATPAAPAASEGLGADIYGQVAPNTAENLPETNPFKKVEANPFKAVQTNPFEQ